MKECVGRSGVVGRAWEGGEGVGGGEGEGEKGKRARRSGVRGTIAALGVRWGAGGRGRGTAVRECVGAGSWAEVGVG